jgi:hypothetical protein
MKSKMLTSAVPVLSLLLLAGAGRAPAQEFRQAHFSGLINDYSPLRYQRPTKTMQTNRARLQHLRRPCRWGSRSCPR